MSDDVIQRLKQGEFTDEDVALLTDDDIRQLVIHYATILGNPALRKDYDLSRATKSKVYQAWADMPAALRDRLFTMVLASREIFWARPAGINNRFGIG